MGAFRTPLHLLPLGKALGDDVVHRRFDKARADSVSLAIALAVVGDECLIIGNVRVEFFNRSQQLACRCVFIGVLGTMDRKFRLSFRHILSKVSAQVIPSRWQDRAEAAALLSSPPPA